MIMTKSLLSYDDMKKVVVEVVKDGGFTQCAHVQEKVMQNLSSKAIIKESSSSYMGTSNSSKVLSNDDTMLINQIIWDLIFERVLTIGRDDHNQGWPHIRLTEYGISSLEYDPPIHDVDGIIRKLKSDIPDINSIIIIYLSECLNTYRINALLSSTIMLGGATEKAVILLIESFTKWLDMKGCNKEATRLKDSSNRLIARRFEEFKSIFIGHKTDIDNKLYDDFYTSIDAVFNIIRKNRNLAGHPTGEKIERYELSSWIHVFRAHCKKIYALINYFDGET